MQNMYAGVTRISFPPEKADEVVRDIQGRIIETHRKLRSEGLKDAFFLVNRKTGEAIGVALWDDKKKLEHTEGKTMREGSAEVSDPQKAPTDFSKLRARAIQEEGGKMESSDWYEMVARV